MKVALVHDYLIRFGGAERVFFSLRKIFKKADVFTLLYDSKKMGHCFNDGVKLQSSFLQSFPKVFRKRHKYLLPFLPMAAENFDFRDYDLVISSSSSFGKGIITRPQAIHICYCHSPMRFSWDTYSSYLTHQKKGKLTNAFIRIIMHYIRIWDRSASKRVDYFLANSQITANRIRKYYKRDAFVIYPPVSMPEIKTDIEKFRKEAKKGFYYLIVSQLTPYKRIDLAVEAFNKMGLPLMIIGEGPDKKRLKKMADSNIQFLGWQPDEEVDRYYRNCLAFIFSGEDDFGIAPVEAMSYGKPVLAYRKGGATETIVEGQTGEFFDYPAAEVLADGIRRLKLNYHKYDPVVIRRQAEKFSPQNFEKEIKKFVIKKVEENRS